MKKLADVCTIKPAKNEARKRLDDGQLVSFVPMEDLGILNKNLSLQKEKKLKEVYSGYTYFADGDVLVAKITPCFENGKMGIARNLKNGIGFGSSEFVVMRPSNNLMADFLFYSLVSNGFRARGEKVMTGAVGHKRVPKDYIESYEIPLPPIAEQKRLVSILDTAFASIDVANEKFNKNLRNAGDLFDAYLRTTFNSENPDWRQVTLDEVCEIKSALIDPREKTYQKMLHVGAANIESKSGQLLDLKTAEEERLISGKFVFDSSMVLYSKIRPYLMKVARPDFTGVCSADIYPLSPKVTELDRDYLFYLLLSPGFTDFAIKGSARAGMPKVNRAHLFSFAFHLPPLVQQKKIVQKLNALLTKSKELESVYSNKLIALEELKSAVLEKALVGQLNHSSVEVKKQSTKIEKIEAVKEEEVAQPSPYIRNQVHAAIIDQVERDGGWTTEVAVAKYDHLLQEVFGLQLGYQFQTQRFGPFDAQIKRLLSSGLGPNRWFAKRNGMIVFGTNARGLLFRQSNLYKRAQIAMQELSRLGITKMNAEKVELLSTIIHSIKERSSTSLEDIREYMAMWQTDGNRTKAEKFSEDETQRCRDFILKNNLHQRLLTTI